MSKNDPLNINPISGMIKEKEYHTIPDQKAMESLLSSSNDTQPKLHWAIRLRKKLLINGSSKWNAVVRYFTAWLEILFVKK